MTGGTELIEVIKQHMAREQMWNEWKATRSTVLVQQHCAEEHVQSKMDLSARPMNDVRLLSLHDTMSRFVGAGASGDA